MKAALIRKAKGLSQTELAELVGVEQPTISRFERGADGVTLGLVRDIARALEVPISDLFADDRTEIEQQLLAAFRGLPEERQRGWVDMANAIALGGQIPA
nr:helix-turn-helix transcriptional regulator [uncultured Roseovarius sp.]